jgi:hypothetical protein
MISIFDSQLFRDAYLLLSTRNAFVSSADAYKSRWTLIYIRALPRKKFLKTNGPYNTFPLTKNNFISELQKYI